MSVCCPHGIEEEYCEWCDEDKYRTSILGLAVVLGVGLVFAGIMTAAAIVVYKAVYQ